MMNPHAWAELFQKNPWVAIIVFLVTVAIPALFLWRKARGSEAIEFARMQLEAHKAMSEEMEVQRRQIKEQGAKLHVQSVELSYLSQKTNWLAQYIDDLRYQWTTATGQAPPNPRCRPPPIPPQLAEWQRQNARPH